MVHIVCGCIVLRKVLNLKHYTTPLVYFWNLGTEDKEG